MVTWIESVSDGLPASSLSGDPDGDYADYDQSLTISSPSMGGKLHYYGLTITGSSFAADFLKELTAGWCIAAKCESVTSNADGGAIHNTYYPTFSYDLVGMDF
jgi:hypothetical protein